MNGEYETWATIGGNRVEVIAAYELDGIKPIIYGIFDADDPEKYLTDVVSSVDMTRIHSDLAADIAGTMTDAADYLQER